MAIQPSASKCEVLVHCSFAFDPRHEELKGDGGSAASRYGSAFHDVTAILIAFYFSPIRLRESKAAAIFNIKKRPKMFASWIDESAIKWKIRDTQELADHVWSSFDFLNTWLRGANPWAVDWAMDSAVEVETSYAVQVVNSKYETPVRRIDPPTEEEHRYEGLIDGEIPGTLDLKIMKAGVPPLVLDHKTGSKDHSFASPSGNAQMMTLGLIPDIGEAIVAINHADRRGLPMIYADQVGPNELHNHRALLERGMLRIGDGSMAPGEWCAFCPAKDICPTKYAEVIPTTLALVESSEIFGVDFDLEKIRQKIQKADAPEIGRMHELRAQMNRVLKMVDEEIHEWVEDHPEEVVVQPRSGKILGWEDRSYETISKKSINDGLGKVEGEKLFQKLRKLGVMSTSSRRELHARADKGE